MSETKASRTRFGSMAKIKTSSSRFGLSTYFSLRTMDLHLEIFLKLHFQIHSLVLPPSAFLIYVVLMYFLDHIYRSGTSTRRDGFSLFNSIFLTIIRSLFHRECYSVGSGFLQAHPAAIISIHTANQHDFHFHLRKVLQAHEWA